MLRFLTIIALCAASTGGLHAATDVMQATPAFEMPIVLSPAHFDRPANSPIEFSFPIESKLDCEAGALHQTIDEPSAKLTGPGGEVVPCGLSDLKSGEALIKFRLPTALRAGERETLTLHFATVPAEASQIKAPAEQAGPTWEFNEGTKASFSGGTHVTTVEGGGDSGYMAATADGQEKGVVIGRSNVSIDGRVYSHIEMRLRHQGPTPTSIAANGVVLRGPTGLTQLPDGFDLFEADLAGQPDWNTASAQLTLSFGTDQPQSSSHDQIIIDWIRLTPGSPVVYAGVIARTDAAAAVLRPYAQWFRPSTSAAYLYVRNSSDNAETISKVFVDQHLESNVAWPLDPDRKSDWFDVLPRTILPGGLAQVRVHLRGVTRTDPVSLTVEDSNGARASAVIPAAASALTFSDITFAKDGSEASLFVHGDLPVMKVFVDGVDETSRCDLAGAAPFHHTTAIFYHPQSPLVRGSYHTWEVRTADGQRAIYTARTLGNDFIIGTYGATVFEPYKDAAINHYINFRLLDAAKIEQIAKLGMTGSFVPFVGGEIDSKTKEFKMLDESASTAAIKAVMGNAAVAYYSAPDEPDGADHPLGVGTHGRSIVAMRELATSIDPATPCFVQIDNTYRNSNYHVYSETMDYSSSHRYNLGQEFLDGDRAGMKELRDSTAPLPYLWVTQLYPIREKIGEHAKYNGRDPLPAEMHIQMLEALGGGTKGFIHYIHSGSSGGRGGSGTNKSLWDSMGPMHQQIAVVGDVAVHSTPADWATSSTANVHCSTLLADGLDVLVVLTNDGIVSTKTGVTVPEISGIAINVALPSWVHPQRMLEVLPGGTTRDIKFATVTTGITAHLETMKEGTILWLKGAQ